MQEFECKTCDDYFDLKYLKRCNICNSEVCNECKDEGYKVFFIDWIEEVNNKCHKCKRIGCGDCLRTCYKCQSENDQSTCDIVCKDCSDFKEINCKYHSGWYCTDCIESNNCDPDYCLICECNENYSKKYQ